MGQAIKGKTSDNGTEPDILEVFKRVLEQHASSVAQQFENVTQRMDNISEGAKTYIDQRIEAMTALHEALAAKCDEQEAKIAELQHLVGGRNKSAAIKRNMTDEDATRALTGDLKDMPHKDAAEVIGLTYAQVYSCRLEFTFKHVHKTLRDAKWVNPWKK